MTEIKQFPIFKHLRSEPNRHILRFVNGKCTRSGRGLAFWFFPMGTSICEVPTDDRELQFMFECRTLDFQVVTIQGEVIYRVNDPDCLANRIDFSINLNTGRHCNKPLEQLTSLFTGTVQKHALKYIASQTVHNLVKNGLEKMQQTIDLGFADETVFSSIGLEMVSLHILDIQPVAELGKALQMPTRERIQQDADEATFQRRAMAVEKERAIAENQLQSEIELAIRQEQLITQQGQNEQRRVEEQLSTKEAEFNARLKNEQMETEANVKQITLRAETEARQTRIHAQANSDNSRLLADTNAENRRALGVAEAETMRIEGVALAEKQEAVGMAEAKAFKERMSAYDKLPANVVLALALQEVASHLTTIEHLNISPDILQTNLADLFSAGADKLQHMTQGS